MGRRAAVELYRATLAELDRLADTARPGRRAAGRLDPAGRAARRPAVARPRRPTASAELADCAAQAAALRAHGIAVEDYDGPLGRGLFLPDDAAMNPAGARSGWPAGWAAGARAARAHAGARRVGAGRVRHRARRRSRRRSVIVAVDGRLELLVPAARRPGAHRAAADAGHRAGRRRPAAVPGLRPLGLRLRPAAPDGRLFVGGGRDRFVDDEWTHGTEPTAAGAGLHRDGRRAGWPAGRCGSTHRWAASVGFTAGRRARCAPRVADGVVAVGGYNGTGNLVGPVAARAAVALALDGTPPPPAPDRRDRGWRERAVRKNGTGERRRAATARRWPPRCAGPGSPRSTTRHAGAGPSTPPTRRTTGWCRPSSSSRATSTRSSPRSRWPATSACRSPPAAAARPPPATPSAPGIVLDFSRHLNRVLDVDPEARTAARRAGRDPRRDHRAPPRRTGCGSAPTRPRTRGPPSAARSATTPAARGRWRTAAPPTTSSTSTCSPPTARGSPPARSAATAAGARPAARAALDRHRRASTSATIRTEFGRFGRQVSGYSLEHLLPENGADVAKFLVGTEGTLGVAARRDGAAGRVAAGVGAGRARLPRHARGRRRRAGAAAAPTRSRSRAWTRGWSTSCAAAAAPAAVPDLPRGDGWLFVETAGETEAEARGRGREARRRRRLPRLRRSSPAPVAARAVAHPRGRRRARRPHPGRRAGLAGLGGRRRAAGAARRLPARVRRADARARRRRPGLRPLRRRLRARPHRLPARRRRRRGSASSSSTRPQLVGRHGGSMSGEHGDGRARGELLPYMYSAEAIAAFAAGQARSSTRANLLNPGVIVDPAPVDADLRVPAAQAAAPPTSASPTRTTAATCPPPCTAASASASAAPTPRRPAA